MRKRILVLLMMLVLCLAVCFPAFAADGTTPLLSDLADLLSDDEEALLLAKLNELSEQIEFDIVVVTTNDLDGKSSMDYADDYYDYKGFGYGENYDGALYLIAILPSGNECWISTYGTGSAFINDAAIDRILDVTIDEYLAYGDFYGGMAAFADLCDRYVSYAGNDTGSTGSSVTPGYTDGGYPVDSSSSLVPLVIGRWLLTGLVAGLVVAFIRIAILKGQMKSVRMQTSANSYIKEGSLHITDSSEMYLYSNVSRVKRESSSSSSSSSSSGGSTMHVSSSGRSHGGGGRKF